MFLFWVFLVAKSENTRGKDSLKGKFITIGRVKVGLQTIPAGECQVGFFIKATYFRQSSPPPPLVLLRKVKLYDSKIKNK